MEKLTQAAVTEALTDLEGWRQDGDAIVKTYRFHDFVGSVDFVNAVAEAAEGMQHHPGHRHPLQQGDPHALHA